MAEGLVRHFLGDKFIVESAGYLSTYVHPDAIEVMKEIGIDISKQISKSVSEMHDQNFDLIITLCDENDPLCPIWYGKGKQVNIPFPDPVMKKGDRNIILQEFRNLRDSMKSKILDYLKSNFLE